MNFLERQERSQRTKRIAYEEHQAKMFPPNRIKSKRPRKYGCVNLSLFSLFFSLPFLTQTEYHHFF